MVKTPVDINQVKQLAATGHFRSVALWLNYSLVPQAIYAQVQTDQYPGYLQVLLEFERPPQKELLVRLVCNRLCRLESSIIRGVYLVGRLIGTEKSLWQQRIRLPQRSAQAPTASNPPFPIPEPPSSPSDQPAEPQADIITATTLGSDVRDVVPSYLIPREPNTQERRRRPNRNVTPFSVVQIRPADIDSTQTSSQRRMNRRRLAPKDIIEQQFKYMRAIVVTGSAAAAFILGCVTEVVLFQKGQFARKASPSLPTFNQGGWRSLNDVETQEIAYRSSVRGPTVPAALEPVAVMPHAPASDPTDPTVTLVFGGEVPVGDVPLQTPDAVGQVLGELDVFREADVAMVGLGNSLASADTSLQENYFERTRSDASDALLQGGIDIVGLTGDQMMDFGRQGLIETLDTLDRAGIYRVGAGRNPEEARRPEILDVKGQRIAYLSYAPDNDDIATLGQAGLNIQERDNIIEDVAALRETVDWIVVNYRWYGDLTVQPHEKQVTLSRSAIDAGADLVVGYHPEQLQGAEVYKSRPIVYSLGDFIFQDAPLEDHDTATLRVSLRDKQMKVEFLPVSVRDAQPQVASGETAKTILKQIRRASEGLSSPLQFPVILETPHPSSPLLKPEKPAAPVKTLGELEPGGGDDARNDADYSGGDAGYPVQVDEPFANPEFFAPDLVEDYTPEADSWEPTIVDENYTPAPENLEPKHTFDPRELEADGIDDVTAPSVASPEHTPPLESPLDSFNTQPDEPHEMYEALPYQTEEPSESFEPKKSVPKSNSDLDAEDAGLELIPEQNEGILMPTEPPLPGYDVLENW
nr:CapA family protein [Leptolyngbyaceae cyanobacterium MAG.088]